MPDEHVLPLEAAAYLVEQVEPDRWTVTVKHSGEVLYRGIGPVEVVESPAPF
jgi:S-adenosylmethionine/arginine decarboxylase-like enzyme